MRTPVWKNSLFRLNEFKTLISAHIRAHLFFEVIQLIALLLLFYFWPHKRLPAPGYAIGVLALLAAIMSLHGDMHKWHKFFWILLSGASLVVELRAIKKDRSETAQSEDKRREEQIQRFDAIAKSLEDTRDRLNSVAAISSSTLEHLTGGNAYCYLVPIPAGTVWSKQQLILGNSGSVSLPYCNIHILELPKTGDTPEEVGRKFIGQTIQQLNVPPRQQGAHFLPNIIDASSENKYQVLISTPSHTFWETIEFTTDPKTKALLAACKVSPFPPGKYAPLKIGCDTSPAK